jgi:hypothetical protein
MPAEGCRDRRRDEVVGGGDDRHQVAGFLVIAHELDSLRRDGRLDHFAHIARIQRVELRAWERRQRAEREFEVLDRIQHAGVVLGEEGVIAGAVGVAIDRADPRQKFAPFVIGVDRQ